MRRLWKWWQRWVLDAVLTHPPPLVAIIVGVFLSVFAVGFWCAHWLDQVDLAAYRSLNVFTDNIRSENLLELMSNGLPIDAVYTWVNGTDPNLIRELQALAHGHSDSCPLSHCLPAPYIALKGTSLKKSALLSINSVVDVSHPSITHNEANRNFTLVHVAKDGSLDMVLASISQMVDNNNTETQEVYWTSDVGGGWGMKQQRTALISGASTIPSNILLEILFPQQTDSLPVCQITPSGAVRLLECEEDATVTDLMGRLKELPESIKVRQAMLMLWRDKADDIKEVDVNRFVDNEELRYSLRSLEKYAPWIRRIYLVTNGQIPYWLNLDHSRLTIITHDQLFTNKSQLPTFSSPAIESHIHRIPGLSNHFLYLNDDVMLGSDVWPEDFYSPATGYKVYLSWSLPECSSGCPGSWLSDGYCDASCNTSACEWDGGDCAGGKGIEGGGLDMDYDLGNDGSSDFCSMSCSDLWIADKYCDQSCNVAACGYDGGDCGTESLKKTYELSPPKTANTTYVIPKGLAMAWMNISSLLARGKTLEGTHTQHSGLRSLSINTAQGVLFLIMKENITATLRVILNVTHDQPNADGKQTFDEFFLMIKLNTSKNKTDGLPVTKNSTIKALPFIQNFTFDEISPKILSKSTVSPTALKYYLVNVNASQLANPVAQHILDLEAQLKNGELTVNGYKKKKSSIISKFMEENKDHTLVYDKQNLAILDVERSQRTNNTEDKEAKKEIEPLKNMILKSKLNSSRSENVENDTNVRARHLLWAKDDSMEQTPVNLKHIKRTILSGGNAQNGGTLGEFDGNLPWERLNIFNQTSRQEEEYVDDDTQRFQTGKRQLLDMFAESLLHVNRLYNSEFGYQARRVPAHMPHFISKSIMNEMQERFSEEFELTSSHKIRQANDMQYSFSYFYYLMSQKKKRPVAEIFKSFDTDESGTLSDREIRTFLTRTHELPLHYSIVQAFQQVIINCSKHIETAPVPTPYYERYADSELPTVSLELTEKCKALAAFFLKQEKVSQFHHTQLSDDNVHFKMVTSNVSVVVHMLDEVRKNPRKFICLNSNIDPRSKDNELIHALVQDTYESLYPVPSSFELPLNYRNRFLYVEELLAWKKWRDFIRALIYACLTSLIVLTLINFFSTELESMRRKWCRRRRRGGLGGVRV